MGYLYHILYCQVSKNAEEEMTGRAEVSENLHGYQEAAFFRHSKEDEHMNSKWL